MAPLNLTSIRSQHARLPFADEKESMVTVHALLLSAFGLPVAPETTGIYLISSNAGFYSSLAFWREVLDKGPGLANPERFPWTLANAPCGAISRAFGITGPNYTFNGLAEEIPAILDQVSFDFILGRITAAWLIAIDFGENPAESTQMTALLFSDPAQVQEVSAHFSKDLATSGCCAAEAFSQWILDES